MKNLEDIKNNFVESNFNKYNVKKFRIVLQGISNKNKITKLLLMIYIFFYIIILDIIFCDKSCQFKSPKKHGKFDLNKIFYFWRSSTLTFKISEYTKLSPFLFI